MDFIHGSVYVSSNLPIHPAPCIPSWCPYVCSLCLCLCFCFAKQMALCLLILSLLRSGKSIHSRAGICLLDQYFTCFPSSWLWQIVSLKGNIQISVQISQFNSECFGSLDIPYPYLLLWNNWMHHLLLNLTSFNLLLIPYLSVSKTAVWKATLNNRMPFSFWHVRLPSMWLNCLRAVTGSQDLGMWDFSNILFISVNWKGLGFCFSTVCLKRVLSLVGEQLGKLTG